MGECGLDSSGLGQRAVSDSCQDCNKPSDSVNENISSLL
jgi:hypothetical protein